MPCLTTNRCRLAKGSIRCTSGFATRVFLLNSMSLCRRERSSPSIHISPPFLAAWSRTRRLTRKWPSIDSVLPRRAGSSRSRATDGYLLQHFVACSIPVLGIEPALNVAAEARRKGIPTVSEFLGSRTGAAIRAEHGAADLVAANNVLAHTPQLSDFVAGLKNLLCDNGVVTVEFPHLVRLIEENLFDTIYHEHFSYFSFLRSRARVHEPGPTRIRRRGGRHARWVVADLRSTRH